MKEKLLRLSLWCFAIALGIFVLSYLLYHYLDPAGGFTAQFQETPAKPFVTLLLAVWGVMFLFGGTAALMVRCILLPKAKKPTRAAGRALGGESAELHALTTPTQEISPANIGDLPAASSQGEPYA